MIIEWKFKRLSMQRLRFLICMDLQKGGVVEAWSGSRDVWCKETCLSPDAAVSTARFVPHLDIFFIESKERSIELASRLDLKLYVNKPQSQGNSHVFRIKY